MALYTPYMIGVLLDDEVTEGRAIEVATALIAEMEPGFRIQGGHAFAGVGFDIKGEVLVIAGVGNYVGPPHIAKLAQRLSQQLETDVMYLGWYMDGSNVMAAGVYRVGELEAAPLPPEPGAVGLGR